MQAVNVTEFRNHLPLCLDRVKSGEELTLTSRGTVVARLMPDVNDAEKAREWLENIKKTCWVGDVTTPLDLPKDLYFRVFKP